MTQEWKEVTDPEELFRLKREGWKVQLWHEPSVAWFNWSGSRWDDKCKFRARPRQPKVVTKKLCAWANKGTGRVIHYFEDVEVDSGDWIRQPHLDLEGRLPE